MQIFFGSLPLQIKNDYSNVPYIPPPPVSPRLTTTPSKTAHSPVTAFLLHVQFRDVIILSRMEICLIANYLCRHLHPAHLTNERRFFDDIIVSSFKNYVFPFLTL